jgi:hypothetical protein
MRHVLSVMENYQIIVQLVPLDHQLMEFAPVDLVQWLLIIAVWLHVLRIIFIIQQFLNAMKVVFQIQTAKHAKTGILAIYVDPLVNYIKERV